MSLNTGITTDELTPKGHYKRLEENNFIALINNTTDLMWSVDRDFNLITSNKPFDDAIRAAGKVIKKGNCVFSASLSPEQEQRFKAYYERAFKGESFMETETNVAPVKFCMEISFSPIWNNAEVIGVACHSRDVSERQKAEEEIIKSNRLYHFLSNLNKSIIRAENETDLLNSVCSIAIETGNFKLAYIGMIDQHEILNITNFHGDKEGQHKIMRLLGIDHKNSIYKDTPTVKAITSRKLSFHNNLQDDPALAEWKEEFVLLGIHSSISLPIIRFGKVIGIFGIHSCIKNFFDLEEINLLEEAARDVSFALENFEKERRYKETESLLLKNENRFRALIENSTDMITLTDAEGNFIYASPSITKIFGYEQQEFIHKPIFDFFHPDDLPCLTIQRKGILNEPGKSFNFQYRILHKNGQWIWCEGTLTNMFDQPHINALVSNFREISEKKKAEREKEKMVGDIIQRSKNLEQFAYIVSHNLRAPVCTIQGLANVMKTELAETEKNKVREYLFNAVNQLDDVTKDLNKILGSGPEISDVKERVSFSALVNTIKTNLNKVIEKEGIFIETGFAEVDSVMMVKSYLQSIFYNLISNSIKYRKPCRRLVIKIRSEYSNEKIRLFFSDNGSGIDLNQHGENVFGLYKRFHPEIEGKGVGLFMVKTHTESIGGTISIKSEPNIGTEFMVELPG
jgi:PAS domain S-box-containing protein